MGVYSDGPAGIDMHQMTLYINFIVLKGKSREVCLPFRCMEMHPVLGCTDVLLWYVDLFSGKSFVLVGCIFSLSIATALEIQMLNTSFGGGRCELEVICVSDQ